MTRRATPRPWGWIAERAPGPRVVVAVEGTRSYGAGLTRALTEAGLTVVEAEQPTRTSRRGRGKSDSIDAHLAVRWALELDAAKLPTPRADGDREALRTLLCARDELTTTGTGQTNRLKALLRDGDDTDRALARGKLTERTIDKLARRRQAQGATRAEAVRHAEIRRLAVALREQRRELKTNRAQLQAIVNDLAPGLTDRKGIGPVCAAQVIASFSHPGRCRNEAAFALGGTSPVEASSGRTTRHRLNRGGDRALNRAIHTIANTRMRDCPATRATSPAASPRARTRRRSGAASSATSPAGSIVSSPRPWRPPDPHSPVVDGSQRRARGRGTRRPRAGFSATPARGVGPRSTQRRRAMPAPGPAGVPRRRRTSARARRATGPGRL